MDSVVVSTASTFEGIPDCIGYSPLSRLRAWRVLSSLSSNRSAGLNDKLTLRWLGHWERNIRNGPEKRVARHQNLPGRPHRLKTDQSSFFASYVPRFLIFPANWPLARITPKDRCPKRATRIISVLRKAFNTLALRTKCIDLRSYILHGSRGTSCDALADVRRSRYPIAAGMSIFFLFIYVEGKLWVMFSSFLIGTGALVENDKEIIQQTEAITFCFCKLFLIARTMSTALVGPVGGTFVNCPKAFVLRI